MTRLLPAINWNPSDSHLIQGLLILAIFATKTTSYPSSFRAEPKLDDSSSISKHSVVNTPYDSKNFAQKDFTEDSQVNSEPDDLMCYCNRPGYGDCDEMGQCDALRVAQRLSTQLDKMQENVALVEEFKFLQNLSEQRDSLCSNLSLERNYQASSEIFFFDSEDWKPACVLIEQESHPPVQTCSIVPKSLYSGQKNITYNAEAISDKLEKVRELLGCKNTQAETLDEISSSSKIFYCQGQNLCNLGFTNSSSEQESSMLVELFQEVSTETLLLYTLVPILLLTILVSYSCIKLVRINSDNR